MKEKTVNSPLLLVKVFIITALIMTIYESIKEFIFKGALTPWESHTITIIITAIIATFTAYSMRSWLQSIYLKEKQIESKEESLKSFRLTLSAVNHIVNNVLNYLQLVKTSIDKEGKLPDETLKLLEESLNEADKQMQVLNNIEHPNDPTSFDRIYPK